MMRSLSDLVEKNNGMTALRPKQQLFIEEYLIDLNATRAAIRAGYSEKTARQMGTENLSKPVIQAAIQEAFQARSDRTNATQDWVLERLEENVERAMGRVPVLDREGNETGEWTYQGSVANRSLELLGKHLGMFPNRTEVSGPDGGPIEHEVNAKHELFTRIARIAERTRAESSSNGHDETDGL